MCVCVCVECCETTQANYYAYVGLRRTGTVKWIGPYRLINRWHSIILSTQIEPQFLAKAFLHFCPWRFSWLSLTVCRIRFCVECMFIYQKKRRKKKPEPEILAKCFFEVFLRVWLFFLSFSLSNGYCIRSAFPLRMHQSRYKVKI